MKTVFFLSLLACGIKLPAVDAHPVLKERVFTLAGRQAYIAWQEDKKDTSKKVMPVLMAIHGSGREALSYKPGEESSVPFYVRQRDLALAARYMFVAISNGPDTWGKEEGLQALLTLFAYVRREFRVEARWVLWGSSAGGVLAHRMVREHPGKVKKVLGTFPVYDLAQSYDQLSSARKALGSREAADLLNPAGDPEALRSVPYLIFHGSDDKAVPASLHSERLAREVNGTGGDIRLYLVPGGHSIDNFALYNDTIISTFLTE